ncbi:preprotein translocase subunit SecG [Buchnera aphidicola (Aphis helianthi)]|uniref:Protein-export membrane protein SecG n=1 Tax=Buchnera aphidicola (Aphis helianthi) TaxID=2315802 RepID=A0A4D6XJS5_9GAMM|nr:preprotein translocase subunit SecG [Buchnera aphidicola]QCI17196.1 preprotein translocase subunit SecG [Buchnera aphidicola (Aphis helianthi)]
MYLFFLVFLIFISIFLNFLILLQPGKNVSNIIHSNTSNNIKLFNSVRSNNFVTNIIGFCACLFLIISLVLCNINDKKINSSLFEDNNDVVNEKILKLKKNKRLNTEIPN